jgi:aerobic carbon-monoxide dehydrogenase medium subunit
VSSTLANELPPGFDYVRPRDLADAVSALAEEGRNARALAGGTDLMVALRHGLAHADVVVDLKRVVELAPGIEESEGSLLINANTPMTDIERDETVRSRIPGLVESAQVVGSVQIRNRATLAGNVCNASPAADTPPMLVALGASLLLTGPDGERRVGIDDFWTGYRETVLRKGDVVRAIEVPLPGPREGTAFLKLGVRRAMEISIVCVGARVALGHDGVISGVGIGLGSVAPATVRAASSEQLLLGEKPTPVLLAEAAAGAVGACTPIDDLRASADYRRAMIPVMVERALAVALRRAGGSS